jgi:hypothetical protein
VRNIIAAPVIVCGLITAAITLAGEVSAQCDSADCVPNVARNVAEGAPCQPGPSFVFGMDSNRDTLICSAQGVWVPTGPLVGLRAVSMPCYRPGDTAQQPLGGNDLQWPRIPGVPLWCAEVNGVLQWVHFDTPVPV